MTRLAIGFLREEPHAFGNIAGICRVRGGDGNEQHHDRWRCYL
jgi:hypothetical protein